MDSEHLKFNYGEYKRMEEKRRRVTLGAMPNGGGHHSASLMDVTVNDRPDTNTFAATLGRKVSTLSWNGGGGGNGQHTAPSTPSRFRSLGRGGNFLSVPSRRKSEGIQHYGGGQVTPQNVRNC